MIKITEMQFHIEIIKIINKINSIQEVSFISRKEKTKKIRFILSNIITNIFRALIGFLRPKKYKISNFRTLMYIKIKFLAIVLTRRSLRLILEKIAKTMMLKFKNVKIHFENNWLKGKSVCVKLKEVQK